MGIFESFLSLWVALAMGTGVLLGLTFPDISASIGQLEIANINLVIACFIWLMIFPMMAQIDFSKVVDFKSYQRGLVITLVVNWLIKPFTMALLAVLFFKGIYHSILSDRLAEEYIAGAILLGAAPCTAMVFVWSQLTKGNGAYTLVQVGVNDLILPLAFAPIVQGLLGVSGIKIPWSTLVLSVGLFVVIPLGAGYGVRKIWIAAKGLKSFDETFMKALKPLGPAGLIGTLILLFMLQAENLIENYFHIALIAVPLTLQTILIFALTWKWGRACKLSHEITAPSAFIGASNFFELAVAVAISLFGIRSGATLATVVGVLIEVPVMLILVKFANKYRYSI